jgi:hypothetical protein
MFRNLSSYPLGTLVYRVISDDDTIIHQSDDRERAEDVAYNHLGRMVTYSARPDGVPRWISEQQF